MPRNFRVLSSTAPCTSPLSRGIGVPFWILAAAAGPAAVSASNADAIMVARRRCRVVVPWAGGMAPPGVDYAAAELRSISVELQHLLERRAVGGREPVRE